ncbi:MAG: regulatory protein RecX [Clostridia bacterium]|nr:regulatory protein RecX [Clostridia bacterium]
METDSREKTLRMAANVLEYRHRSSRALYQRLLEKGAEEQDAAYAVARLQQLGFLNDGEYGKLLVRDLCRRGYGPTRIRQYLREKQLDSEDIDTAMEDYVFLPEKLQAYIDSKLRGQDPDRKALKRVADGLCRRGFSWGVIQSALRDYTDSLELEETP